MKNRLKYFRHKLQIDTQTEFAELLGLAKYQLSRFENQRGQPNIETAIRIFQRLKPLLPDLHLEDLFELPPE